MHFDQESWYAKQIVTVLSVLHYTTDHLIFVANNCALQCYLEQIMASQIPSFVSLIIT